MIKKLRDFTEEEISRICNKRYCPDCPFDDIENGCIARYLDKEIEVPEEESE